MLEQRVVAFWWINLQAVNIVTVMSPDICRLPFASSPYGHRVCRRRVKRKSPVKCVAVFHETIPYRANAMIQPWNWHLMPCRILTCSDIQNKVVLIHNQSPAGLQGPEGTCCHISVQHCERENCSWAQLCCKADSGGEDVLWRTVRIFWALR